MTKTYDVIIVGGNPAETFAALELYKASASGVMATREVQKRLKTGSHPVSSDRSIEGQS